MRKRKTSRSAENRTALAILHERQEAEEVIRRQVAEEEEILDWCLRQDGIVGPARSR